MNTKKIAFGLGALMLLLTMIVYFAQKRASESSEAWAQYKWIPGDVRTYEVSVTQNGIFKISY
ncbi:MAG: hypothetical protein EOP04_04235 [Proteobacteria bacterium]|nr:MAG: hypothetical protein EOP04_04235 [Pseudomonadota bacterium]